MCFQRCMSSRVSSSMDGSKVPMNKPLLTSKPKRGSDELDVGGVATTTTAWGVIMEEVKGVSCIACPMVAVTLSQYLLQMVSVMMAGHLGELPLASTSIAISISVVSGFSPLVCIPLSGEFFFGSD